MATIHVDGKEYEVDGATNLLEACLSLGLDIPYFCWHPALGSVGACRQCAVKQYRDENDTRGRLVMSCMTPSSDNTYISIEDDEAKVFRKSVVEWLMTNHPHDCPVCAEGGNCHLQDMTVMTGHSFRRYRFNKRTHNNQQLGPFIAHEMNRCIACYRCVRYYKDYADGTDLGVYGSHDNVYFGRIENGALESEFSGNLVEVCPTGVFTDKTHAERYNRKWDMQFAPSICQQCSVGCNISPGERYGELRRIENRYNGTVNHYFLCDRGRFGYGYVNLKDRPRHPQIKENEQTITLDQQSGIEKALKIVNSSKCVMAIGSARASLESNFALQQLVGNDNFYTGIEKRELELIKYAQTILKNGAVYTPSLREIEKYDAILILGEDITQTAARIALSVRQALKGKAREMAAAQRVADWQIAAINTIGQRAKHPLFITALDTTRLDDVAAWHYNGSIDEQARLGFAIAHAIHASAPAVSDLNADLTNKVKVVAEALSQAKRPLIIAGTGSRSKALLDAANNVIEALKQNGCEQVGFTFVPSEVNSMGAAMLSDNNIDDALSRAGNGDVDTLIVMENDLYRHANVQSVNHALKQVKNLIVIDHQNTNIAKQATLLLSAASFAESDGTVVNNEGRAQRFFQVYDPAYYDDRHLDAHGEVMTENGKLPLRTAILSSWHWICEIGRLNQRNSAPIHLDNVIDNLIQVYPELNAIKQAAPNANFRIDGQKMARSPHRYSGRTSILANKSVHEPQQPQDADTPFAFSMEGYNGFDVPRQQIPFAWAPNWNSPQAWNKFQDEVGGSLKGGDPGIRLFEAQTGQNLRYCSSIPAINRVHEYEIAPYYHLFGSEELSQRADVIKQRMPDVYVMINVADAVNLNLKEGDIASFNCDEKHFKFPVKISKNLATGLIGLPIGLSDISPILIGMKVKSVQGVTL